MSWKARREQQTGGGLKGSRPRFIYTVSPWDMQLLPDGSVVPCLGVIWEIAGLDGARMERDGSVSTIGAEVNAARDGRTLVPHDIVVKAWGEEREGYIGHTLGGLDGSPHRGDEGPYWLDAWTRPRFVHGRPRFEFDHEGWHDFLKRLMTWLCPEGPDDEQIEIARLRAGLKTHKE